MSRESRRGIREKSIARRMLERGAREEIDEFLQPKGVEEVRDQDYDDYDDYLYYVPDDDWPDDYDWPEDEPEDDPYDRYESWIYEDDFDGWMNDEPIVTGEIGTYYKDAAYKTYLCCRVHGTKCYVDVHTGLECSVNPFLLEKVG